MSDLPKEIIQKEDIKIMSESTQEIPEKKVESYAQKAWRKTTSEPLVPLGVNFYRIL